MKSVMILVAFSSYTALAFAENCDCYSYPFKPNPPCFGHCVALLSAKTPTESVAVRNIDPGVSVGINVLSKSTDRSSIDFKSIKGKSDLEWTAWESIKASDSLKLKK